MHEHSGPPAAPIEAAASGGPPAPPPRRGHKAGRPVIPDPLDAGAASASWIDWPRWRRRADDLDVGTHVVHLAVEVEAVRRIEALELAQAIGAAGTERVVPEEVWVSWWVAADDRLDGSRGDSAMAVEGYRSGMGIDPTDLSEYRALRPGQVGSIGDSPGRCTHLGTQPGCPPCGLWSGHDGLCESARAGAGGGGGGPEPGSDVASSSSSAVEVDPSELGLSAIVPIIEAWAGQAGWTLTKNSAWQANALAEITGILEAAGFRPPPVTAQPDDDELHEAERTALGLAATVLHPDEQWAEAEAWDHDGADTDEWCGLFRSGTPAQPGRAYPHGPEAPRVCCRPDGHDHGPIVGGEADTHHMVPVCGVGAPEGVCRRGPGHLGPHRA
jgi:hypothetical protein